MDLGYAPNERLLLNLLGVKNISPWYVVGESLISVESVSVFVKDLDSLTSEQEDAIREWAGRRFGLSNDDVDINQAG